MWNFLMKIIITLYLFSAILFASIGNISSYDGKVMVARDGKVLLAKVGFLLSEKDIISTKKHSRVKISLKDNTIISIGQNAKLDIADYVYNERKASSSKTNFKFLKGAFSVATGKIGKIARKRFKLETKTATIGIRGTVIVGNQKEIACVEGAIEVTSQNRSVIVPAGMIVEVPLGRSPLTPTKYSDDEFKAIYSELDGRNAEYNYFDSSNNIDGSTQVDDKQMDESSGSSSGSRVENVTIKSDAKNISNIASGSKNIAKQNVHSLDVENGVGKNLSIDGKAVDVNNIASGTNNESSQDISSIKIK